MDGWKCGDTTVLNDGSDSISIPFDYNNRVTTWTALWTVEGETLYTITFNYNLPGDITGFSADGLPTSASVAHGQNYTINIQIDDSKSNYSFIGWLDESTDTIYSDSVNSISRDMTLTAQWVSKAPSTTYSFNGSTIDESAFNSKLAWILFAGTNTYDDKDQAKDLIGQVIGVDGSGEPIIVDCVNNINNIEGMKPFDISGLINSIANNVNIDSYSITYAGYGSIHITLANGGSIVLDIAVDIAKAPDLDEQDPPQPTGTYTNYMYNLVATFYVDPLNGFAPCSATSKSQSLTNMEVLIENTGATPLTAEEINYMFGVRSYFVNGKVSTQRIYDSFKQFILDAATKTENTIEAGILSQTGSETDLRIVNGEPDGLLAQITALESSQSVLTVNVQYTNNTITVTYYENYLATVYVEVTCTFVSDKNSEVYLYNLTINDPAQGPEVTDFGSLVPDEENGYGLDDILANKNDTIQISSMIANILPATTVHKLNGNDLSSEDYQIIIGFIEKSLQGVGYTITDSGLTPVGVSLSSSFTEIDLFYLDSDSNNSIAIKFYGESLEHILQVSIVTGEENVNPGDYASEIVLNGTPLPLDPSIVSGCKAHTINSEAIAKLLAMNSNP